MHDDKMRQLLRVPLQPFGEVAQADLRPPCAALQVKRLPSTLRISLSSKHNLGEFLQHTRARHDDLVPQKDWQSWSPPADWRGREFRRMLRTWTPRSSVEVAVHPANLGFFPADREIAVSGYAPKEDLAHLTAKLLAPLTPDGASRVMTALATHLGLAELRGAARRLHQKRLSRNALPAADQFSTGPQPAAPSSRHATSRLPRRQHLRPALHRALPARWNLHFAAA